LTFAILCIILVVEIINNSQTQTKTKGYKMTNELNEWLEEADELARQTGIAFGFGRVENWDDARREASLLSEDPDPDLARAGIELLEMIPK
jgi:hypothetical protein